MLRLSQEWEGSYVYLALSELLYHRKRKLGIEEFTLGKRQRLNAALRCGPTTEAQATLPRLSYP